MRISVPTTPNIILFFLALVVSARADYLVTPNKAENRGTWDGWGCSISWWGRGIGSSAYEGLHADLFFTTKIVPYLDRKLPGLGLNIVRYNVGGGGNGDSPNEQVSPTLPWFKDIDGYWINGDNADPASKSWDWSRDANQRSMLKAAQDRGVNWIEFFSNSPMWWMNNSNSSDGGNLLPARLANHAHHMAAVVKRARDYWKIPVHYIEPFNEPSAWWWKYPMKQEGCRIPKEQQKLVLAALASDRAKQGISNTLITASDENSMDQALTTWNYFKEGNAAGLVDKVNVHGYLGLKPWRDNSVRKALREAVGKKRLWMSEYCDGEGSGMTMAQTIMEDLNYLQPTAWIYWQPVEPDWAWGLVNANYAAGANMPDRGRPLKIYTKYYVFAQFTRFICPGATILGSSDPNTVTTYNRVTRELVFVTLNGETEQEVTYDLGAFNVRSLLASVTYTSMDGRSLFQPTETRIQTRRFAIKAMPRTIYSVVVKDVGL